MFEGIIESEYVVVVVKLSKATGVYAWTKIFKGSKAHNFSWKKYCIAQSNFVNVLRMLQ